MGSPLRSLVTAPLLGEQRLSPYWGGGQAGDNSTEGGLKTDACSWVGRTEGCLHKFFRGELALDTIPPAD